MKGWRERDTIRLLHLLLSIPILGFLYGPVEHIPHAAWFTRWIAMPVVLLSGLWLWLKPKILARINAGRQTHPLSPRRSERPASLKAVTTR